MSLGDNRNASPRFPPSGVPLPADHVIGTARVALLALNQLGRYGFSPCRRRGGRRPAGSVQSRECSSTPECLTPEFLTTDSEANHSNLLIQDLQEQSPDVLPGG